MKKRVLTLFLAAAVVLTTGCARRQKEGGESAAGDAAATATTEEIVLEEVSIPKADALVNKVLNPPAGRGEVEVFDGKLTYRETEADFFLQGEDWENTAASAAFEKGETASRLAGELVIRMKPRNAETDADGNAAKSEERRHALNAYLVKTSGKDADQDKASRYELYLYDDTDDTWELETFKTKDVTTGRMMIKNMIKDREVYYYAPGETEGRELSETEKTIEVNPEDPGSFVLRGVIDVSELATLLDGYGTGTAIGDAKDTVTQKASEAAQKAEEIAGQAAQKAADAIQKAPGAEDNVVFLGDAAKEFLESQGHDLQRILEEHGDELQQYYEENKDKIKEKLDESGIREQIENFDVQDIVDSGQKAVQTVQDYLILRELLLSVQEAPELTATFNAYTGELMRVELYLKSSSNEESNAHLNRFTAIIRYDDHTAIAVDVPEEVTAGAEDKESGMIFHRVIEEMEEYRKSK